MLQRAAAQHDEIQFEPLKGLVANGAVGANLSTLCRVVRGSLANANDSLRLLVVSPRCQRGAPPLLTATLVNGSSLRLAKRAASQRLSLFIEMEFCL